MKILKPFEVLNSKINSLVKFGWISFIFGLWFIAGLGETHLFPTISQVFEGLQQLWVNGLVIHVFSSLSLCFSSVAISIIISLIITYLSPLALLKPIGNTMSVLRYLPLTGISYYISIFVHDARNLQIWVLVAFMSTFLITSLLAMVHNIDEEEFEHARTLGCTRWEILLEIVIKGRIDYVIECIRQNLAIVWMMLVSIESILAAAGGLGFLIKNNDKLGGFGSVIALQMIIVLIGLGLDFLLNKIRIISFRYSNI